ncbi:MAG TPA: hypothetical protein EYO20_03670 [Gemmatimonadetes bacterium]|nr:hypothetical protein [Gemmatimonadota bacterium]
MNRILSVIGVVLVVGCGGPEPRDLDTLQQLNGVFMNPVDGQPYSGPVFGFQEGRGWVTGSLKDGELDGLFEMYYNENGQLKSKGTFKDGEMDGPFAGYHENGQLFIKETYKDEVLDGPFERYLDNGELSGKGTFKDGEQCGEWLDFGETVTYDPC